MTATATNPVRHQGGPVDRARRPWQRPPFGRMHTRRAAPRTLATLLALPREGTGDFRRPVAVAPGSGKGGRPNPGSAWHNPVLLVIEQGHRDEKGEPEYIPLRNGLPEPRPYVWRAGRWRVRAERHGLDLRGLALADAAIDADERRARREHARSRP